MELKWFPGKFTEHKNSFGSYTHFQNSQSGLSPYLNGEDLAANMSCWNTTTEEEKTV